MPESRRKGFGPGEEVHAVGHAVAHQKVGHRGHREIHQDLDQSIDLVLLAHRAQLQKGKARMHGQHHDGAEQDEQRVCALLE
ncbi:Uncharacterized protein APZ42_004513 [Daphnia magna]|uniref:Uncharacterized protein n=1 Tax=Daphnia magna TaxID=35525 RepID=A0A164H0B3_9CRUS|nr:Uncharacterized protein APZ42_004513 [Daphnia magna]